MSDINVIALVKSRAGVQERYIWLYDDDSIDAVRATLGRFAAEPQLSFTWFDAATVSARVRRAQQTEVRTRDGR